MRGITMVIVTGWKAGLAFMGGILLQYLRQNVPKVDTFLVLIRSNLRDGCPLLQ
jgi:hypothetical protein